jgi:hypothetical protein
VDRTVRAISSAQFVRAILARATGHVAATTALFVRRPLISFAPIGILPRLDGQQQP